MTIETRKVARPLEGMRVRAFKALALVAGGTAAVTALGLGAANALGYSPEAVPSALMGFVSVLHLTSDHVRGILAGRPRLGVHDAVARKLAKDVEAVARREPDGAWVVMTRGGRSVEVLDRKDFEDLAGLWAKEGLVVRLLRFEGESIVVERYEGGVLRTGDGPGAKDSAVQVFDRRGNFVSATDVDAPAAAKEILGPTIRVREDGSLARIPWRSGESLSEVKWRKLPTYVVEGTEFGDAVHAALKEGPVHARSGNSWLAYPSLDEEPRVVADRSYQRLRRTNRDHVEIASTWDGTQMTRLTCGRLDSSAHGTPARTSFDAAGALVEREWFVEGRPADEAEALEAHAAYDFSGAVPAF